VPWLGQTGANGGARAWDGAVVGERGEREVKRRSNGGAVGGMRPSQVNATKSGPREARWEGKGSNGGVVGSNGSCRGWGGHGRQTGARVSNGGFCGVPTGETRASGGLNGRRWCVNSRRRGSQVVTWHGASGSAATGCRGA